MLRGIIICPDSELAGAVENLLEQVGHISVARSVDRYPTGLELTRLLRAAAPQVVFISIEALSEAVETLTAIEETTPGVQIVAISHSVEPQTLIELMRLGIREFLSMPFRVEEMREALGRIMENLERRPVTSHETDLLFSFLPAKAGSGASTVSMNLSVALSRLPETRTLLIDFDLNSGMQRFMLKLNNEFSVVDAAEHATQIDETLWAPLVSGISHLDVLHSGRINPGFRIEAAQVRHLLEFARRIYRVVCADLSGNLEKYSLEIMQESKKIFLICTPEIASLHLARERFNYLVQLDLGDRVRLVLNRAQKKAPISTAQIEELLGIPVFITLPNDYQTVTRALTMGKHVEPSSDLGKQFNKFAGLLIEKKKEAAAQDKKKSGYFSLFPPRPATLAEKKSAV